jgi:filamentous hemagglutinin
VIVNGQKIWKFSDGATAKVGSREAEELARARVENNANADASFAGGVPVRPKDGQVPAGTAQTDTPIGKHLIEAEVKLYKGQPSSISGGHNMDNFNQTLQANGGQVIGTPKVVAPGIYEIEYRMPGTVGKNPTKTVYDPAKYSDTQMALMANEAVGKAIYQWNKAGAGKIPDVQLVEINGIKFEVPISSYKGQVYVPTAYPSGK